MTKIEMQAALLAEEVENFISLGAPITTSVVTALNQLKFALGEAGYELPSYLSGPSSLITPERKISNSLSDAQIRAIINGGN